MLLTTDTPDAAALRPARDLRRTGIDPNFWFPLARSHELKPGKAIGATFAGEPIALVRAEDGTVFALEDRCAHRQVPLHAGVVKGRCVQCCYHGWTYDETGRCVTVPYLDAGRSLPNGVRAYPCREAHGLIFVFPGDRVERAADSFPDLARQADPRYRTRTLDRTIACHYSFMHENLMDMNHQFLHRRLMGRIRTTYLDLRRTADRVEVDYTFSRMAGRQSLGERFMVGAKRRRPAAAPAESGTSGGGRNVMTIATEYPYQRLRFWSGGGGDPALDLWNVYVPLDRAQRTNRTFGLMMIKKPSTPGLIHLMWPAIAWFTDGIFAEDKAIVEMEQQAFDAQGADRNHEIFPVIQALRAHLVERGVPL